MTTPAVITVFLATTAMACALVFGIASGNLMVEGAVLLDMPWGIVTLVEVYVGIALFACWMFWREASRLRAGAWLLAAVLAGNIVSCIYVLLALRAARGDARRFWFGHRAVGETE